MTAQLGVDEQEVGGQMGGVGVGGGKTNLNRLFGVAMIVTSQGQQNAL